MPKNSGGLLAILIFICAQLSAPRGQAQSLGNAGSLRGTVMDPSGASVPSAILRVRDPRSGVDRTSLSGADGAFQFTGLPFGGYRLTAEAPGFEPHVQTIAIPSSVPVQVAVPLGLAGSASAIEVSAMETSVDPAPSARSVVDRKLLDRIPVENAATGLSEMVAKSSPGVAADGNGFVHPLGEHADTSISIDNQPVTDQQAKIFSNQLSTAIIQSMEVITGAPPAEFGGKTSLIINVTTQSGLGRRPFGSMSSQYGSFGSWSESVTLGQGSAKLGNFVALSTSGSGRFLDSPEFLPMHNRGNAQSLFDRFDWQPNARDGLHVNLSAARSWFQTPNTYDAQAAGQDQRSQIRSFNIAPGWTHLLNSRTLFTLNPFLRFDRSQYFPSSNPFSDQPATLAQSRYLTNAGFRTDVSWSDGRHNAKFGASYWHTLLREDFSIGITDGAYNTGENFIANLLPYDLTRGGRPYSFRGDADVAELAFYAQDSIRLGRFTLNPGLRYDRYRGLSSGNQLQPRFGLTWRAPLTNTAIRLSYARLFETPYNENLIVASEAAASHAASNPFGTFRSSPPKPGNRNQFNAGMAQNIGRYVSIDADYFWKFTRNAFDFDSLFLTPITFPIGVRKSKIDGLAARVSLAEVRGFSAYSVFGHTRARSFGPRSGGLVFDDVPDSSVYRMDHSEEFEQTTFLRYQHGRTGPWLSFTWRYNSGLALPGVVPNYESALELTADEQAQMGLYCGSLSATPHRAIRACSSPDHGATRVSIPSPGTHNDDLRPSRVAGRNLYDAGTGIDDLLRTEGYKVQLRLTALNLTNREALYNFLSTFSGTHFVTPRSFQAEVRLLF